MRSGHWMLFEAMTDGEDRDDAAATVHQRESIASEHRRPSLCLLVVDCSYSLEAWHSTAMFWL